MASAFSNAARAAGMSRLASISPPRKLCTRALSGCLRSSSACAASALSVSPRRRCPTTSARSAWMPVSSIRAADARSSKALLTSPPAMRATPSRMRAPGSSGLAFDARSKYSSERSKSPLARKTWPASPSRRGLGCCNCNSGWSSSSARLDSPVARWETIMAWRAARCPGAACRTRSRWVRARACSFTRTSTVPASRSAGRNCGASLRTCMTSSRASVRRFSRKCRSATR